MRLYNDLACRSDKFILISFMMVFGWEFPTFLSLTPSKSLHFQISWKSCSASLGSNFSPSKYVYIIYISTLSISAILNTLTGTCNAMDILGFGIPPMKILCTFLGCIITKDISSQARRILRPGEITCRWQWGALQDTLSAFLVCENSDVFDYN